MTIQITKEVVTKLLDVVDAGLSNGMGEPVPGNMCVEAAVCYALGLPHGDDPQCVAPMLRSLEIRLNDSRWSSPVARADGMRRLAVIQLGSKDNLDTREFRRLLVDYALRVSTPKALRSAASVQKDPKHKQDLLDAASRCEREASRDAALSARKIADAADAAAAAAAADAYAAYAADYAATAADAAAYAADYADYAAAAYAAADAAYAAYAADYAATAADAADNAAANAARDKSLADYAEAVVQMLIEMNVPGVQWLELTDIAA